MKQRPVDPAKSSVVNRQSSIARRTFLKHAAGTAAAAFAFPAIVPSSVFGATAPSNRIALGFAGVGSHGIGVNLRNFIGNPATQVVAVCDVDANHMQQAVDIVHEKYAEARASGAYAGCGTTGDFRDIIARDDIDAVVVSTPDHWHVPISMAAVKAGKDVYCEKPLTLTVSEGRALSDAVSRYGRVFQTGSEFRAQAYFVKQAELVRNGRIGQLKTIIVNLPGGPDKNILDPTPMPIPKELDYDLWLGPAPWAPYHVGRCHYEWRWIFDYSGGELTDWGGHLVDQAQWGNDTEHTGPIEVEGEGVFPTKGLYNTATDFRVVYTYANGVTLVCTSQPRELAGSIRYVGTEGSVFAKYGQGIQADPPSLLGSVIGPGEIHLYTCAQGPEWNFIDCVKSRREPYYPAEVGHRSVTICHLGNIAMLLRRKLRWDPETERFVNDDEANRMLARAKRAPWRL